MNFLSTHLKRNPNEDSAQGTSHPRAQANVPLILLSLIGFGVSLYAFATHLKHSIDGSALSCDINETLSCSKVYGSSYGEVAGIPLGAFGMAFFGIVFTLGLMPKLADVSERWIGYWQFITGVVGLASSLFLAYVSYFVLNAVCPVCSIIHGLNVVLFVYTLVRFLKVKNTVNFAEPNAFLRMVSTSLMFVTPPLLIGVLAPSIAPMFFGKNTSETTSSTSTTAPREALNPELFVVAKNNFVGKGEDYRKGSDNAKAVLMMWSDFECPACRAAADGIEKALAQYSPEKVLFVYRNYPLSSDCNPSVNSRMHANACNLAEASRCAGQQGKFWEYKEWAFSGQDFSDSQKAQFFSEAGLVNRAKDMGLDAARFEQCLKSDVEMPKIREDINVGNQVGVRATPTLFLNGKRFEGDWRRPESLIQAFEAVQ